MPNRRPDIATNCLLVRARTVGIEISLNIINSHATLGTVFLLREPELVVLGSTRCWLLQFYPLSTTHTILCNVDLDLQYYANFSDVNSSFGGKK